MTDPSIKHARLERDVLHIEVLERELMDEDRIRDIASEVAGLIDAEPRPRVVLSLPNLRMVSSNVLGSLISLNNRVRARGGQLRLAAIGSKLEQLLTVTQLDSLFEVHLTPEQAAASIP